MNTPEAVEAELVRLIDQHLASGAVPAADEVSRERPELAPAVLRLFQQYLDVQRALEEGVDVPAETTPRDQLPIVDGFRVIERLGAGGMGDVYKVHDLKLNRVVAAKFLRQPGPRAGHALGEARALALFADPRIVQVFEVRDVAGRPVIIMEFVDGFELGHVGPSLEHRQLAHVVAEVADALERAHALGIQHRDLKPSNIMLDGALRPKIVDFGLSGGDESSGHFRGTLPYLAPEQLDSSQPLDARTDVYALGVVLYELLAGITPYTADSTTETIAAIREGRPRLPVELRPGIPEPLQAIALKAMERDPRARYQSAREMQLDLQRYVDGRPVTARPSQYDATLSTRVRAHVDQVREWLRLRLVYPHEASTLLSAYRRLEAREDDWIVASRVLSYSQIVLYLGAFFLFAGSLFYFGAYRFYDAVTGLARPLAVLGLPLAGLTLAGAWLYRKEHQAVGVAFYLAGVGVLPLFLLILLNDAQLWRTAAHVPQQLFSDGSISNRQLQITIGIALAWSAVLALRTSTAALSTMSAVLGVLLAFAVMADLGLRDWIIHGQYDAIALHLAPVVAIYVGAGFLLERQRRPWFALPVYLGAAVSFVAVLDLLALDGRLFHLLGVSLQSIQPADVSSKVLIDTLSALSLNGLIFYAVASVTDRRGTPPMQPAAQLLLTIAPFSTLEPIAYLSETAEYWIRLDWVYLSLAVATALLSEVRQRRSFYYAGLINSGVALYLIADRRQWFGRPSWATAVIVVGLAALIGGFVLDARERRRRTENM